MSRTPVLALLMGRVALTIIIETNSPVRYLYVVELLIIRL